MPVLAAEEKVFLPQKRPDTLHAQIVIPSEVFNTQQEQSAEIIPLYFNQDDSAINPAAKDILQATLPMFKKTKQIHIFGYATGKDGQTSSAREISLSRAFAIRQYLIDLGITETKIDVRAQGNETDQTPIDRVDIVIKTINAVTD